MAKKKQKKQETKKQKQTRAQKVVTIINARGKPDRVVVRGDIVDPQDKKPVEPELKAAYEENKRLPMFTGKPPKLHKKRQLID